MPSKSQKQHNLMEAAAHDAAFAKAHGISQDVAREFIHADAASGKFRKKSTQRANRSRKRKQGGNKSKRAH